MSRTIAIEPLALANEDFRPIPQLVREHAADHPELVALRDGQRVIRWGEMTQIMDCLAGAFLDAGLTSGGCVALLAQSSAEYMIVFLAALAAGATVAPLPVSSTEEVLARLVADCQPDIFAVSLDHLGRAEEIIVSSSTRVRCKLILDGTHPGWTSYDKMQVRPARPRALPEIRPQTGFNIIYSSGTTGTPKGIVHDHRFRSRQAQRMREVGIGADCVWAVTTPMYSNTTLVAAFAAIANGGSVAILRKFDADAFLGLIERVRATNVTLVPVLCQRLLRSGRISAYDLSSLRTTSITSSPLPVPVKQDLLRQWPGDISEMYGQTEGGLTTVLDMRRFPEKLATVGRPSANAIIRIVDKNGREVPSGQVGEIIGRSPVMMSGYYKRPDLTEEICCRMEENAGIYFRTGDLGRFDKDGFLHIAGRKKDVIISGGFNIYASDLEDALMAQEGVLEAAVIARKSDEWGETPVGIAVLDKSGDPDVSAILDGANRLLGRTQRISALHVVDALPRNALGKILKTDLRARFGEFPSDASDVCTKLM